MNPLRHPQPTIMAPPKYDFPKDDNLSITRYGSYALLCEVGQTLQCNGVLNVAVGSGPRGILGARKIGYDCQFVVPDDSLDKAVHVLEENKCLRRCSMGIQCPAISVPSRSSAIPDEHVHINRNHPNMTIDLFKKSSLLWELPDIRLAPPNPSDPFYTHAGSLDHPDPLKWRGNLPPVAFPVKILTRSATVNALCYLLCRDFDTNHAYIWKCELQSMEFEVMQPDDLARIEDCFMPIYKALVKENDEQKASKLISALSKTLSLSYRPPQVRFFID